MDETLFDETQLAGMALKNRLFRSATYLGMCNPDGTFQEGLLDLYRELAAGGVAALVTELTDVGPGDSTLGDNMRLDNDALIPEYAQIVGIAHEHDVRIMPQLNMQCYTSAVDGRIATDVAQLSLADIADIKRLFVDAAVRAQACGFDGIQLHAAYGWLLHCFLNPATNRRADAYGGSPENRVRLACEIVRDIKAAIPGFPVCAKVSFYPRSELLEDGSQAAAAAFARSREVEAMARDYYAVEECVHQCALMYEAGLDFVEVLGDHSQIERGNVYHTCYLALAKAVHEACYVPVVLTGANGSLEALEEALEDFGVPYFGLSRALIREPDLPNRWLEGDETGARCVHCDRCYKTPRKRCSYILRAQGEW